MLLRRGGAVITNTTMCPRGRVRVTISGQHQRTPTNFKAPARSPLPSWQKNWYAGNLVEATCWFVFNSWRRMNVFTRPRPEPRPQFKPRGGRDYLISQTPFFLVHVSAERKWSLLLLLLLLLASYMSPCNATAQRSPRNRVASCSHVNSVGTRET